MTKTFVEKKLFDWGFNPGYSGFAYLADMVCTMDEKDEWTSLGQALRPVAKKYSISTGAVSVAITRLTRHLRSNGTPPAEISAVMNSKRQVFAATVFFALRNEWEAERCE